MKDNRISLTDYELTEIYYSLDNEVNNLKRILKRSNLLAWKKRLSFYDGLRNKIYNSIVKRRKVKDEMKGGNKE